MAGDWGADAVTSFWARFSEHHSGANFLFKVRGVLMEFLNQTFDVTTHADGAQNTPEFGGIWGLNMQFLARRHPAGFEDASRHASIFILDHLVLILVSLVYVEIAHGLAAWLRESLLEKRHRAFAHWVFWLRFFIRHQRASEALGESSPEVTTPTCGCLGPPIKVFNLLKVIARRLLLSRLTFDRVH